MEEERRGGAELGDGKKGKTKRRDLLDTLILDRTNWKSQLEEGRWAVAPPRPERRKKERDRNCSDLNEQNRRSFPLSIFFVDHKKAAMNAIV